MRFIINAKRRGCGRRESRRGRAQERKYGNQKRE
jgi:hypothetical protein